MLSQETQLKLRDPAYLDLHLVAVGALAQAGDPGWYDANFLRRLEAAKLYLAEVRPDVLDKFVVGFEALKPPADFEVREQRDLFDAQTHQHIVELARTLPPEMEETNEIEQFGRIIVHDHPEFLELQREILPQVSAMAGQKLELGYNFLSLYGGKGVCGLHMDEPISMYTLDYCIEQDVDWPIHISKPIEWPTLQAMRQWSEASIRGDASLGFQDFTLKPNSAILFNGSSQWHYRDPIPKGGMCSLLFFHYYPAGCANLINPRNWAEHFAIEELGPLCDLFEKPDRDGLA